MLALYWHQVLDPLVIDNWCHDGIKSDLVKQTVEEISLNSGSVLDDSKILSCSLSTKIKDNPESFSNYRTISVLPCFSKVIHVEQIVHERRYDF